MDEAHSYYPLSANIAKERNSGKPGSRNFPDLKRMIRQTYNMHKNTLDETGTISEAEERYRSWVAINICAKKIQGIAKN